ncbi:MAG TPA: hypothetical protein PKV41_06840, partial [Candidatus Omnitrophota bacterium]|nr:hypothetical protein [Candidatus Omnitrophota bacterium]
IKEKQLKSLLQGSLEISDNIFSAIVPSPKPYHYRNRIDMKLKRVKDGAGVSVGFTPAQKRGVIPVDACYIAEQSISDFIPELKRQAAARITAKHREANLVVRTGDDGRVFWGGVGRRSCELPPKDYLWTQLGGRRIFYSLDTFFQANLSILPRLFEELRLWPVWEKKPAFYDLYGGVGLFSVGLCDCARNMVLIEETGASAKLAHYNAAYNRIDHLRIIQGRVEDHLPGLLETQAQETAVAMIDPPRAGLSADACRFLSGMRQIGHMIYLSCNPEALARDLRQFMDQGWTVERIVPFDFFPKTRHVETLVLLGQDGGKGGTYATAKDPL